MTKEDFLQHVECVYKRNYSTLGFIPKKRFREYYDGKGGTFYRIGKSFILIGSLKSATTPIYAVYVSEEDRNKGATMLFNLISLIPKKRYRVRAVVGHGFWRRVGLEVIRTENNNHRCRDVTVFEGSISIKSN